VTTSSSAFVVARGRPLLAVAAGPGADIPGREGADRRSRLHAGDGTHLVHADLHNHTLLSDGAGSPNDAFAAMRDAGVDVAALTDHATLSADVVLPPHGTSREERDRDFRYAHAPRGLDEDSWVLAGKLAEAVDDPGSFTAIRGFEWTEPWLGHVNVWLSEEWTDVREVGSTAGLMRWLTDAGASGVTGLTPVFGFNHPGREPGRFERFRFDRELVERMVSLEMFNRGDDYLFEGLREGRPSPLLAALDAGWRPGLIGVTDEHAATWGSAEGRGRAGLWVREHSRAGVIEALQARRSYATRLSGLRLDASLAGERMGRALPPGARRTVLRVDVDRGPAWVGRPLVAQLLRPEDDPAVPAVRAAVPLTCGEVLETEVNLGNPPPEGRVDWVVLRIADPGDVNRTPGPAGHEANNRAVAYASPWWLRP